MGYIITKVRSTYSAEFKHDSAKSVTEQSYTIQEACDAVGEAHLNPEKDKVKTKHIEAA